MKELKCIYFITSIIFGGLSFISWLFIIPCICLLAVHVFTKHVKDTLIEHNKLLNIITRIETLERRTSFSNNVRS